MWAKVDTCFSFNKPLKQEILHLLKLLWPKFCVKYFPIDLFISNIVKIRVKGEKNLNGASVEADFWHGDNLDHNEKKALNNEFHWGPVHGENGLLK